jgi:hypothetical protein
MSQRIRDASAKVARLSYPLPRRRTMSFQPLRNNWPSFVERLFSTQMLGIAVGGHLTPPLLIGGPV